MKTKVVFWIIITLIFACSYFISNIKADKGITVEGIVYDENRLPMEGAIVREKATENFTYTNKEGKFILHNVQDLTGRPITAWKEGYYIRYAEDLSDPQNLKIYMVRHKTKDDPEGSWDPHDDPNASISCYRCLPGIYEEWKKDAHSQTTQSPFVLSMYNGTDYYGNQNIGYGYKTDFPNSDGNCGTCHAPGVAYDNPWNCNLNEAKDTYISKDGVFCYFCHSIYEVNKEMTGQGDTGTLSIKVIRSKDPAYRVFFGPYDDDDLKRASKLPLQSSSYICAPCHNGKFWNVPIYTSFPEWLASPYPEKGIECQTCHMPAYTDKTRFAFMPEGSTGHPIVLDRDPSTIFSHLMPGSRDEEFLKKTFDMVVSIKKTERNMNTFNNLEVKVDLTNVGAGHDAPTDSPFRNIVLLVTAKDKYGNFLKQIDGPKIPEWGGVGKFEEGNYAGYPGKIFAKILKEDQDFYHLMPPNTKTYFPAPEWRPITIFEDTRIPALGKDSSKYVFKLPIYSTEVEVDVKVIFRRFFKPIMDEKKYNIPDIIMNKETKVLKHYGIVGE